MASRVQSSGLQSGEDVTSDSFALAGVAAGSLLVLCVAAWRDTTNLPAPTVSDNNGNTWVRVNGGYQAGSFNSQRVDIYYAQNANVGNTTVTVTADGSGAYLQWVVEEWSGMETADVVDTSGFAQSTTGDAAVTQSATTSQAESVTFAAMTAYVTGGNLGAASPSGYTRMAYQSDPDLVALEASYKINSSAAQESASWSHANTGQLGWGAVIATFKAAAVEADPPSITNVDTDDTITSDQTNVVITGTDFDAATVEIRQGAVEIEQSIDSQNATTIQFDVVFEGASDLKHGSATLAVINDDAQEDTIAITIEPPSGQLYVDVGTPNTESDYRITAVDDLEAGDQIQARGEGGGAAPAGLTLNADATFMFSEGNTPAAFDVRVWDVNDATWGAWATQDVSEGTVIPLVMHHRRMLGMS